MIIKTCAQCGSQFCGRNKLCSPKCLNEFRAANARRTIAVSGAPKKCIVCSTNDTQNGCKTCGPVCLKKFRSMLAKCTIAWIKGKCVVCGFNTYGERKTCSYSCQMKLLYKNGEPYRQKMRAVARATFKLAADKRIAAALREQRQPVGSLIR